MSCIIRCGTARCSTSLRCSATATFADKLDARAYRSELEKTYRTAQPAMQALLAMMDVERRWAIADRDPMRHWSHGRVALLGDAAHPTLQSLAQGACMAIEDGFCLAAQIELADGDFAAAFRRYQASRLMRTARVTLEVALDLGILSRRGHCPRGAQPRRRRLGRGAHVSLPGVAL